MNYSNQSESRMSQNAPENLNDVINNILNADSAQQVQQGGFFWGSKESSGTDVTAEHVAAAIDEGRYGVASYMLDNQIVDVSSRTSDGSTILHRAVNASNGTDRDAFIESVIGKAGTLVNAQDAAGDTPLICASRNGDMPLCDRLVQAGADKSIKNNAGQFVDTETIDDTSADGQEGGFFWSSNKTSLDDKVINAAKNGNADVVEFMASHNIDVSGSDADGKNVLHYLSGATDLSNVRSLLSNDKIRQCVNRQDRNGDTPLISAVKAGNHALCDVLVENGADKSIKNKDGLHVDTETPTDVDSIHGGDGGDVPYLANVIQKTEPIMYTEGMPSTLDTERPISGGSPSNTEQFLDMLVKDYITPQTKKSNKAASMSFNDILDAAGVNGSILNLSDDVTDTIKMSQTGGARKFKRRIAKVDRFGDEEDEDEYYEDEDYDDKYDKYGDKYDDATNMSDQSASASPLGRLITRQTSEIHTRVIERIMELMNVDADVARNYKSVFYQEVKREMPNLSSLDRAIEMEKRVTKDRLDEIDIDKVTTEIKAHLAEKAKLRESTDSDTSAKPVKKPAKKPAKKETKKETKKTTKKTKKEGISSFADLVSDTSNGSIELDEIFDDATTSSFSL